MAWKESHKEESRKRILNAAGQLFMRKGFDQVGIDEVMQAAGMTRGAFYAHFNSKIDLYEQAMLSAGKAAAAYFGQTANSQLDTLALYLSEAHLNSTSVRCPLPSLVSEVAHDDERVRQIYTRIYKGFVGQLDKGNTEPSDTALLQSILMIGGMALARSLTDKTLSKKILDVSHNAARSMIS